MKTRGHGDDDHVTAPAAASSAADGADGNGQITQCAVNERNSAADAQYLGRSGCCIVEGRVSRVGKIE